jgi:sulfite exporter TauE/SafE
MSPEMQALMVTAISIACLHTASGPDHYLPFVALSKARGWSLSKTIGWTITCGLGHVLSSVAIGLGGAAIGWSISKISWLEHIRGGVAGWVMLCFGVSYTIWGWYRLRRNIPHKHFDIDTDGGLFVYEHKHGKAVTAQERFRVTPWVMFIIFVLGPCEPMIPLLYFPAAQNSGWGMLMLIIVYTICTLVTMLTMVVIGHFGFAFTNTKKIERYVHVLGGITILLCGVGMLWMGW